MATTTRELRAKFLNEIAPDLINQYSAVIKGETGFRTLDSGARKEAWDTLKQMMLGTQEAEKISCATNADIISLLRDGLISIKDAKELMSIISMKFEIEELSALRDKLNEATVAAASR